jgi:hypothetical protein
MSTSAQYLVLLYCDWCHSKVIHYTIWHSLWKVYPWCLTCHTCRSNHANWWCWWANILTIVIDVCQVLQMSQRTFRNNISRGFPNSPGEQVGREVWTSLYKWGNRHRRIRSYASNHNRVLSGWVRTRAHACKNYLKFASKPGSRCDCTSSATWVGPGLWPWCRCDYHARSPLDSMRLASELLMEFTGVYTTVCTCVRLQVPQYGARHTLFFQHHT